MPTLPLIKCLIHILTHSLTKMYIFRCFLILSNVILQLHLVEINKKPDNMVPVPIDFVLLCIM